MAKERKLETESLYDSSIDAVEEEPINEAQSCSEAAGSQPEDDRNPPIFERSERDPSFVEKLPTDLWGVILCLLPVADYVRSGAVCRSWRRATVSKPHRLNTKSPWLMLANADKASPMLTSDEEGSGELDEGSGDPDSFTFINIADGTHHSFFLPQLRGKRIAGSSCGSIMASDATEVLLLDPLTGTEVRLPPITFESESESEFVFVIENSFELEYPPIEKLVFLPSSSTAMTIWTNKVKAPNGLSIARVGDDAWTKLGLTIGGCSQFCDLIIHKGVFYMVNYWGSLMSFDPGNNIYTMVHDYLPLFMDSNMKYLVESLDGEHLLLVCRKMDSEPWMTKSFEVYRHDMASRQWVENGSLGGQVAVFVGSNHSFCIFTRGLPELRGNCIYFTEDGCLLRNRVDFGVFDLSDGSIQRPVALHPSK